MTSWESPAPGAFSRTLRFGEWISEPVTPLFESWLVTRMEDRLHERLRAWVGQVAPRPHHVVVNGWYYYSLNWASPRTMLGNLPGLLAHLVREPRRVAAIIPPTVRFSIPLFEREWREEVLPGYRAAVQGAERRVDTMPVGELPVLIDELADQAGEYFASIAAFAGAAYKLEMNLARFYRRHLRAQIGGSHLTLLAGFGSPQELPHHAVATLDWCVPPPASVSRDAGAERGSAARTAATHERLSAAREQAETAAFAALAGNERRLRSFRGLLAETQRLVPIREAHVRELTLAWPALRRAVLRIGDALAARDIIGTADDVFFLTRSEALAGLESAAPEPIDTAARRALRAEQTRLDPPLVVGHLNPALRRLVASFATMVGAVRSDRAIVSGTPAAAGRATGVVRIVRGPETFGELDDGEILVAPVTAPAWTPLFLKASAVVTDVGSAAAHASVIAREYGIPAVVGCGDATVRLHTGMRVTVDGSTGNVEPA